MSPSSKHRHGASPSSSPYRRRRDEEQDSFGEISEEEDDTFTILPKKVTIEQHKKWKAEGTPLQQFQNKQEGKKKEEYVTIQERKEEEYVKIQDEGTPMQFQHVTIQIEPDAPPMPEVAGIWVNAILAEGTPLQFQHDQEGKKKEEYVTRQEEEYVKIQVEPDVPKMQGVEAQNSFSNSGPWNESESGHGVMSYAVLIILVVAEVILGLDFFGVI